MNGPGKITGKMKRRAPKKGVLKGAPSLTGMVRHAAGAMKRRRIDRITDR